MRIINGDELSLSEYLLKELNIKYHYIFVYFFRNKTFILSGYGFDSNSELFIVPLFGRQRAVYTSTRSTFNLEESSLCPPLISFIFILLRATYREHILFCISSLDAKSHIVEYAEGN